ncbi:SLBB domain-containing protein [Limnobacter humi]|uniref:SLBB domain-containing protein n=1 Tax=Limnobacter humi TaxID=1778671 RepID=A0ABT1WJQ2_9BURK|nr:SLBB domain-containing protein [Limnobacter humi]MCQ8897740.1 SLBB domain-containing protein [Limnobacter humi]
MLKSIRSSLRVVTLAAVFSACVLGAPAKAQQSQLPFPFMDMSQQNAGAAGQGGVGNNSLGDYPQGVDTNRMPRGGVAGANSGLNGGQTSKASSNTATQAALVKPLPERPIGPFQRFVQETTGRLLPLFGENVLQKTVDLNDLNTPVSSDYEIGAGDELFISIWGAVDVSVTATVDRDGQINIPSVGTFPVAGVKARNLDQHLSNQVGKYFRNFKLSTSLGKLGGVSIYVAGQALAPGMHRVASTSTLASVLFGVAQPGLNGSFRDVQLRRGGETVAKFDLYELLRNGQLSGDRKLQSGDVVYVGATGPRIALNVEGPAAAIFELKPGETLQDVLQISGVDQSFLRKDQVLIEGFSAQTNAANPQAPRAVEQLAYARALTEAKLKDGDIVTLFQNRLAFSNDVTLKGNVADPARYPYFDGMRVADLVPNTDALIRPDYFRKKSALVGYNKDLNDKALLTDKRLYDSLSFEEQAKFRERLRQEKVDLPKNTSVESGSPSAEKNNENKNQQDPKLEVVEDTIRNLLPSINWDYAVIERLDRKELKPVLVPFNLRKAMAKDPEHNLALQPGDVVTIFSVEDADIPKTRKTALIKVTGEVSAPGYYQVAPGETLRDVLVKAGGLTENAFLFGTKVTRKSILKQQQEQFQKALDQAERLLLAATNKNAASALNPAEAANVQAQAVQQRAYLDRLRGTKPDGRVVVNVQPEATRIAELPPLVLEDGDTVAVPAVPGQVGIYGSVYTQGAFAYQKGKTVFDYLNLAGGAAKSSDTGSIFVLRANGTVESAQQGWIPFVSGLRGERALPGDVIYVPEDFERVSFMKGLLDISQIFYQVGLGAAAVNALQK